MSEGNADDSAGGGEVSVHPRTTGRLMIVVQVALAVLGAAALVRGGYLMITSVKPIQWLWAGIWLGAGIVVHDAVIAPVTLLLGRVLRPGNAFRFGWLTAGTFVLLSVPLIQGAAVRRNPTVIPDRPWVSLLISLALVAAGVVTAIGLRAARALAHPPRAH